MQNRESPDFRSLEAEGPQWDLGFAFFEARDSGF